MQGILFKQDMIKAILKKRKTVTRRLSGLAEINQEPNKWKLVPKEQTIGIRLDVFTFHNLETKEHRHIKPRYQVGEIVYIKEAHYCYGYWRRNGKTKTGRQKWLFRASGRFRYIENQPTEVLKDKTKVGWFKRSALFMPAKFARTFLKITDVRPES